MYHNYNYFLIQLRTDFVGSTTVSSMNLNKNLPFYHFSAQKSFILTTKISFVQKNLISINLQAVDYRLYYITYGIVYTRYSYV